MRVLRDVDNSDLALALKGATEEVQNDADGEDEVQKDGWYEDEDGNYYYYEKGEMITEEIVEIEDEDGTYGYWFDSDGIMFKEGETWV